MSATHLTRKDIKQQDEFLSTATRVTHWVMQRRKSIVLALLIVVAVFSVLAGVRSFRMRQEENAAAQLAIALRVYGSPVTEDAEGDAEAAAADEHSGAGHQHFASNQARFEAAVAALQPITQDFGGYPSGRLAAFYLGAAQSSLGQVEEAIAAFERAAESSAPLIQAMARQRLGDFYVGQERFDEAVAVFDRLVASPPDGFPVEEALTAKARAHEGAGDVQAAMLAYQRVADEHEGSVYGQMAGEKAQELAATLGLDLSVEGS